MQIIIEEEDKQGDKEDDMKFDLNLKLPSHILKCIQENIKFKLQEKLQGGD
jgi:hypothetical protein